MNVRALALPRAVPAAPYPLGVPRDARRPLALAWLGLALAALVGAGLFSLLLVLSRAPYTKELFATEFFRLALVVHVDLSVLTHESELELLRSLAELPGALEVAAMQRAPHRLTHLSQRIAASFHRFYTECRVVSDDEALTQARLWLCAGTKQVLANLLALLGVSAPESMERSDG